MNSYPANNPFVAHSASNRFPDLNASPAPDPSAAPFTQWLQSGAQSPMGQQQPPFQQQASPQYNPGYFPQQGFAPQSQSQFQPTSSFGQQLAGPVNGSSYGYLQGQNMAPSPGGYNPVQQQLQQNPGYIAQFDPYANLGQLGSAQPQQQPPQLQQPQMQGQPSNLSQAPSSPGGFFGGTSTSPTGQVHPREYIRMHKAEVESWDTYAWKQLLSGFDALKESWETRKKEIEGNIVQLQQQQYSGYYAPGQIQQEVGRLQGMIKDSESNFDSVAASSFQMHEVFENYRQSGDLASKRRVREASNAAIASLPDWPPLAY
ncbi:hypothetical protein DFH07DRAFT_820384 [Mycena maculata]|uniref:Uncharacterized protein n=1 Tax=Mycena maculata TaxID=230809 RepID=A0AAD7J3I8_9AGAR|nr:hypothetical protein DFH07DRAFT_820384 [Mycena maculata]